MGDGERLAAADPYFYVCTDQAAPHTPAERRRFFDRGAKVADELLSEVETDLPGWSTTLEIGCGVGRLLLPTAQRFDEARGVDVSPTMLALLEANTRERGISNVRGYLPESDWDEPAGSADYVFSILVFQHIETAETIETYVRRIGRALRAGGVAQLQFDTRPPTLLAGVRAVLPDTLLPRTQRRGIRRVRRDAAWVHDVLGSSGLELLREREAGTAAHRFIVRRPA